MTLDQVAADVDAMWERDVIPTLCEFTRIPNVSPAFDPGWEAAGNMTAAARLLESWCRARELDASVELKQLPGRTPVLLLEVAATREDLAGDTVLLYGHMDKQPEMAGWREGLGPWTPVRDGDRIFGRGVADDGYAVFSAVTAIEALRHAGGDHARLVVLIEASEESGSPDLPPYIDELAGMIGTPSLVIGLDAGCDTYDRLWVTNALRGLIAGALRVDILTEGVHSGLASGVAASSFRILRMLLDRIEDSATGELLVPELHAEIPQWARIQAASANAPRLPFVEGARPVSDDASELVLNVTWRPTLSVIGMDGVPGRANAGNVLRPFTAVVLSFRLPPTVDPDLASAAVAAKLLADPPYGARVRYHALESAWGWASPEPAPWLAAALDDASQAVFGKPAGWIALGGTIPFMAMLGERFPAAEFVITGVLGPGANAHGPNEFLDVPTAKRVTATVAHLLQAHAVRPDRASAVQR